MHENRFRSAGAQCAQNHLHGAVQRRRHTEWSAECTRCRLLTIFSCVQHGASVISPKTTSQPKRRISGGALWTGRKQKFQPTLIGKTNGGKKKMVIGVLFLPRKTRHGHERLEMLSEKIGWNFRLVIRTLYDWWPAINTHLWAVYLRRGETSRG